MNELNYNDAFITLKNALSIFKSLREVFPKNKAKELESKLQEAEDNIEKARVLFAKKLNYHICHCAMPPGIMLFERHNNLYKCEKCGHTIPFSDPNLQMTVSDY